MPDLRDDLAGRAQAHRRDRGLDLARLAGRDRRDRDIGPLHRAGQADPGHGLVHAPEHHDPAVGDADEILALGDPPGVEAAGPEDREQDQQGRRDDRPASPPGRPQRVVVLVLFVVLGFSRGRRQHAGRSRPSAGPAGRPGCGGGPDPGGGPGSAALAAGLGRRLAGRQQVRPRGRAVAAQRLHRLVGAAGERAHDDHVLRRGQPGLGLDDLRQHAGDVVGPAAADGQVDQLADRVVQVGVLHQGLVHGVVADDVGQPVRAQQVPVSDLGLDHGQVRLGRDTALQRPHHQRALRVRGGGLGRQPALVDQRLDQGVVVRDPVKEAVAEQVSARVADVAERGLVTRPQQRGQRGAHALGRGVGQRDLLQLGVRVGDGVGQRLQLVDPGHVGVQRRERRDRDRAGDLAGRVPAHAVGDGEQVRARVRGVLVTFAQQADVGPDRVPECNRHLRNSKTVLPMRTGTPGGTGIGWVTFCRSRYVPLVEPRSSTIHSPFCGNSLACLVEA